MVVGFEKVMKGPEENDYQKELRVRKFSTYSWMCCSFIYDLGHIISQFFQVTWFLFF